MELDDSRLVGVLLAEYGIQLTADHQEGWRNVARLVLIESPTPNNPREPLSAQEARKLLAATHGQHLDALWAPLLILGLGRSEACALHWDDVDFATSTLRISKGVQRVDGQLREFLPRPAAAIALSPLPPRCLHALADHHRRLQELHGNGPDRPWPPAGYIFGARWGTPL